MLTEKTTHNPKRRREWAITLALMTILLAGGAFRFYNVNWDKDTYHIHPDERHTTMVVTRIQWPASLGEYFDTSRSPLNPRNQDTVYFYGTLPLFLTKFVAGQMDAAQTAYAETRPDPGEYLASRPNWTGYDQIHLVGRVLSALFDLGTVLLTFFLARRLFDWRVGLAAAFLLAFTVLNVQGSHYFAVDTYLTFFVTLTLWFTLDLAEGKGWPGFVGLGLSMGLTLACKVSVFLLVAVVAVGAWIGLRRRLARGQHPALATTISILGLGLAVLLSLGIFRVAQPYAFAGPNYDRWDSVPAPWGERFRAISEPIPEPIRAVVMLNPQWVADIVSAGAQQTGEADLPWGRQWTERAAWLWPLENMVKWTLGLPLGLAAWLGVGVAAVQIVRAWRRRRAGGSGNQGIGESGFGHDSPRSVAEWGWSLVILPLTWVLLTFFWQGMQYVKSVRYFMPIHPFLVTFAAFLVAGAWDWARARQRWAKLAAGALAGFVLLGTLIWAFAFIQIFTEPVTRVQATRWMYENVPSAATLHYRTAAGETGQLQIPLPSSQVYPADGQWMITSFTPPHDLVATDVVMNDLTGLDGPSDGIFEVVIASQHASEGLLAQTQIAATFGGEGGQRHLLDIPDAELAGEQTYYFQSRALRGAPLIAQGSAIANEHFDDPLPFSMDGRIAFGGGPYIGLDLTLYDEDTPEKLEQLLDILDQADYISMSSGRLWQSIPRLPMRYPVTSRYYELLFAGELGFDKAVEFHAYPRLFGIEFDDTWAEEQFTVYDHPKVLIYQKTADYDRERVQALLSDGIDWASIPHWLNPRDLPEWRREQASEARQQESIETEKNDLMLTEEQRQIQEAGGTWASIFDRNSLPNRWPTASWLILLGLLGLATLPLTVGILRRLPDRGYILARPVGVLLLAWLSWMLTNLTSLHYTRDTILLALGLIAAGSWATLLLPGQRRRLAELWRSQKRLILINEALFLAFFAAFWFIRWGNPDLWHPWKGGEKPMDFAYLNAVIKSTEFPPYDPWFAGGYLNYYYFGQVMVGTLVKLVGIVPNVAYNLVIPTWFAMTAMGAFSVTYNLVKGSKVRRPLLFALVGALFVAVLGNLGEIHLLLLKLAQGVMDTFESTIPGLAGLLRVVVGSFEVLFGGRALPIGLDEWYWNASRAIPSAPGEAVITEFPFFTFLYADLHAHLIALPLTFLSLAVAIAVVKGWSATGSRRFAGPLALLLLWALTIGAMRTTNTWDVPPHLILALGALAIGALARKSSGAGGWVRAALTVVVQFGLLFLLSWWLLYQPFWAHYGTFYDSLLEWEGTRTPIWAYLVVYGLFLFAIVSYLLAEVVGRGPLLRRVRLTFRYGDRLPRLRQAARIVGVKGLPVRKALVGLAVALFVLAELFLLTPNLIPCHEGLPDPEAGLWANLNLGIETPLPCTTPLPGVEVGAYDYRGLLVFALGLPLGILGLLLLVRPGLSPTRRLWAFLVLLGLAMSLGVEVIVIEGDIARMNTVFKFYLQVWLMWGVASAAALAWLAPRLRRWALGRRLWLGILAFLVFCAALYPLLAAPAKIRDRFDPDRGPELDGWAYMETAAYSDAGTTYDLKWDLAAIRWLLDHVVGSPVILEAHASEYRWGARYAINTGLPTVLGWNWHQRQQRAAAGDQVVWDRASDVALIYNTPVPELAASLLDEYHVRYVVVGPLERAFYDPLGLDKFEQMAAAGLLDTVYSNQEATIYKVNP